MRILLNSTRLKLCKMLTNKRMGDYTPVLADYQDGKPYRWYVNLVNDDQITINSNGDVIRFHDEQDKRVVEGNPLPRKYQVLGDNRLRNLRDTFLRRRKKLAEQEKIAYIVEEFGGC